MSDERQIWEKRIAEEEASLERHKREVKVLEEEYRRRTEESERRRKDREEKENAVAKLKEEAAKLTAELDEAQRRAAEKEELVRELNQLKEELRCVNEEKRKKLTSEEPSLTEEELEMLNLIDKMKARISVRKENIEKLETTVTHMEEQALEREQYKSELECERQIKERELKELEEKLESERDEITEMKAKSSNGGDSAGAQSLYAEAEEERQEAFQKAKEMYKAYQGIKTEIAEVERQIKKVNEEKQNAPMRETEKMLATLEAAYARRVQDLEIMVTKLSSRPDWSTPLEFQPNDLNTEEFELFHQILALKKKKAEEWKREFGRVAQLEMSLSHQAERLKTRKEELLNEIADLEKEKTKPATPPVVAKVERKVHFASPEGQQKKDQKSY